MRGAVQLGASPVWPRPFNPAYDPKAEGRYAAVAASMEADGCYERTPVPSVPLSGAAVTLHSQTIQRVTNMRTVQQIFDAVIDAGLYWGTAPCRSRYMCHALQAAQVLGCISWGEHYSAATAVWEYLGNGDADRGRSEALACALHRWGFARHDWGTPQDARYTCTTFWDFTKLYRDWANRPMPAAPALADLQESNQEHDHG